MTTDVRHITADELFTMPTDSRCELVRGEVINAAPAGFDHGAIVHRLQLLIGVFVDAHQLGVVVGAETGFRLFVDPDTVRGVDVGFVRRSRIPSEGRPTSYWEGAPDLAAEVLSPHDRAEALEEKIDDYLTAGTIDVLILNPRRKTVTLHRLKSNPVVFRESDRLSGLTTLPGFECIVADIFGV